MRAVVDTNVLVRALMNPRGAIARIISAMALGVFSVVYSDQIVAELDDVLQRPRIAARLANGDEIRRRFLDQLHQHGVRVIPDVVITVCRDPKDNMFLEAALAGHADVIVSGDDDLLSLGAFAGIPIVTPERFPRLIDADAIR